MQLILSTAPTADAPRLARAIVEARLAACCNLVPQVESIYWWDGAIQQEAEVLLVFKTTLEAAPELQRRLAEIHPYDTPEILQLPLTGGHPPYLEWVAREVRPSRS